MPNSVIPAVENCFLNYTCCWQEEFISEATLGMPVQFLVNTNI